MARPSVGGRLELVLFVVLALWLVGKAQALSVARFVPTTLDEARVAELARKAGFPETAISSAVAVARCESAFRTSALGDTALVDGTWGPSIGLWQIRSLHADLGSGRHRDAARLADPLFNARAAYEISRGGTNWSPWTCRAPARAAR